MIFPRQGVGVFVVIPLDTLDTVPCFSDHPDVAVLAKECGGERDGVREVVSAVVRAAWSAAQEWTVAWRGGTTQLKAVVAGLLAAGAEGHIQPSVHQAAAQLAEAVTKMRGCVRTVEELVEQLHKVEQLPSGDAEAMPLFSTLTLHHMVRVLEQVCEDYRCETEVKAGACSPLPASRCPDVLNTCVTLWTHHTRIHTHHYPLKLLLRETQQL